MSSKKKGRFLYKLLIVFFSILIVLDIANIAMSAIFKAEEDKGPTLLKEVKDTDEYSYISLEMMSESFAEVVDDSSIKMYLALDDEGHTYIIAVEDSDLEKLQPIINYTYSEVETQAPELVRLTGYSTIIGNEEKELAIDAFNEFAGEEILTESNFPNYMGNYYLDVVYDIGISSTYIIGSAVILVFLIVILISIINKNRRYRTEGKATIGKISDKEDIGYNNYNDYKEAPHKNNNKSSIGDDEVLLGTFTGEYRAPGSIFVKNGRFCFTNYRLIFCQLLKRGIQASIDYEDIDYVRRILFFGVWIYLKDGRKITLRILHRRGFVKEMRKHVFVE